MSPWIEQLIVVKIDFALKRNIKRAIKKIFSYLNREVFADIASPKEQLFAWP